MPACRQAFEKWHDALFDISAGTAIKNEYGYPRDGSIQMRWQVWQAAHAESAKEATIKTDNTQALYNALAEIERLKSDREEEMQGLLRVIEGQREDIERLKRVVDGLNKASFMSCENHLSGGKINIGFESLEDAQDAMFALSAAEKEYAKC